MNLQEALGLVAVLQEHATGRATRQETERALAQLQGIKQVNVRENVLRYRDANEAARTPREGGLVTPGCDRAAC